MKKFIDWLFWKRTWFRVLFVMLPITAVLIGLLIKHWFDTDQETTKYIMIIIYFGIFILGIIDNDNIDGCDYPLNQKRKK